jgi:hypothetical protein
MSDIIRKFYYWEYYWISIEVGLLCLLAFILGRNLYKYLKRRSERKKAFLSYKIQKARQEALRETRKERAWQWLQLHIHPNSTTVILIAAVAFVAWLIPLVLSWLIGAKVTLRANPSSLFPTLWGAQVGLAAAAIPVLIFIIELSKDEKTSAMRSAEVLIRETWVFPITMYTLIGSLKFGFDVWGEITPVVFKIDVSIFVINAGFILWAYYRALFLMFNRTAMKKKSIALLKEKMAESIDYSADTRVGNNILAKSIEQMDIRYDPWGVGRTDPENFYVLSTPESGRITDVNLLLFEEFVEFLDSFRKHAKGEVELSVDTVLEGMEQAGKEKTIPGRKGVALRKAFRDLVTEKQAEIITLEKQQFEDLDLAALERRLKEVFEIEEEDVD